ncbi:hypothetical protein [Mycolicibacterium litorale]|nr:hypothetical protein [Mycolicibacterium litorale]
MTGIRWWGAMGDDIDGLSTERSGALHVAPGALSTYRTSQPDGH